MIELTKRVKDILSIILPGSFGIVEYKRILPLLPCRAAERIPQKAKSVICTVFPYYTGEYENRNISKYAMIADYHQVAGDYLDRGCEALTKEFSGYEFKNFVDNSPIREVTAANLAGLGVIGRHGLLINPTYGDYVFIGEIVTDLQLSPDEPSPLSCNGCGKCIKICPNGALLEDGGICLELCRSHITQKKGQLSDEEQQQIRSGGLVWGCDKCSDVCPMNPNLAIITPIKEFLNSVVANVDEVSAKQLLKSRAFNYRGEKVIQRNIHILDNRAFVLPSN